VITFTPGPWTHQNSEVYAGDALLAELVDLDGEPYDIYAGDVGPVTIANGYLIAAAPALYHALKRCVATIERPSLSPDPDVALEHARAALAAATGDA
jgi:hypothetical protein